ncbi:MAG TPA: hypothetical protein VF981_03225 [Gemmatimonadaceae bacterium]
MISTRTPAFPGTLVAIALLAATPALLQSQVGGTGTLAAQWGDPLDRSQQPTLRWTFLDDRGVTSSVSMPSGVLQRAGGFFAVNGKRVSLAADQLPFVVGGEPQLRASFVQPLQPSAQPSVQGAPQLGSKPYALILCKFSDVATEPHSPAFFTTLMTNAYPNLDHYFRELSANQMNIAGSQVFGWFMLPQPVSYYGTGGSPPNHNLNQLALDCTAAADASVDFTMFAGIITQYNAQLTTDGSGGSAWGGIWGGTLDGVAKGWPFTWMPLWAAGDALYGVYGHEMGHSLGLPHSSGPYGQTYDSKWDVMSSPYLGIYSTGGSSYWTGGHTIIPHKDALGWIPSARKVTITGPTEQTVTLEQAEFPPGGGNPLFVHVPIPGSASGSYSVEARKFLGYDQPLPGEAIVIHAVSAACSLAVSTCAKVVDPDNNGNPNDAGAMWVPGETFDDGNGIKVKVNSQSANGWNITVTPGNVLTVTGAGTGSGQVSSQVGLSPAIGCTVTTGGTSGTCAAAYYGTQTVTLTASPQGGSFFAGWSGACNGTGSCFVAMNAIRSVVATFDPVGQCTLTLDQTTGGTIALTSGTLTGDCGRNVSVTATPSAGYSLGSWSTGGSANPLGFALNQDLTLSATFVQQCTLTLNQTTGGTIALTSGTLTGNCGRSVTVTATPNTGYSFGSWSSGGSTNPNAFVLNQNLTLSATFTTGCGLTLNQTAGGSIALTSGTLTGTCGRSVTVTATPNPGFSFGSWSSGGSTNPYTFQLDQSLTLSATFFQPCALTLNQTTGGTIALTQGTLTGACGRSVTVTATPGAGYAFGSWSSGGSTNPNTFLLTQNLTLSATFTPQCALTLVQTPGGTIALTNGTPAGACGRGVTATATPSPGYVFIAWSTGGSTNPITFDLTQNVTLSATFTAQCSLTLNQTTGGSIALTNGTLGGACGRNVSVTATPNAGYGFTAWSTGGSANPLTFTINQHVTLSASFTQQCTLTLNQTVGGTIALANGTLTGDCGRSVTVSATPSAGYNFAGWSTGGSVNPTTFGLIQNLTLSATFVRQCTLALSQTTGGTTSLTGGTLTGDCGRSVTVLASSSAGYRFDSWSIGGSANPTTFALTGDLTLSATFTPQCTLALVAEPQQAGTVALSAGELAGDCNRTVIAQATPNAGYAFLSWSDGNADAARAVVVSQSPQTLVGTFVLQVDIQLVVDRLVSCVLASPCELTSGERHYADQVGNRNGVVDVGDLLAVVEAGMGATLSREKLLDVMTSPRASSLRLPVRKEP